MFKLGNKGMIKISCKKFSKDTNIFNKKIKYHKWCRLKKSRKKTRTQRVKHYSCLCIWSLKLSATTDKTRIQFQCSHWTKGIEYVPVSKGKKKKKQLLRLMWTSILALHTPPKEGTQKSICALQKPEKVKRVKR